jgi:hypothetical protein
LGGSSNTAKHYDEIKYMILRDISAALRFARYDRYIVHIAYCGIQAGAWIPEGLSYDITEFELGYQRTPYCINRALSLCHPEFIEGQKA